jgi:hypothetical protein
MEETLDEVKRITSVSTRLEKAETRPPPKWGPGFGSRSLSDQRGLTPLPSSGS